MPNWCSNTLTLVHEDRKMISRAVKAAQKDALFNEFAPCPQALSETTEGSFGDKLEQARLNDIRENNRQTYGYSSWYDFAIGEWGCKWDISNGSDDYKIKKVDNGYAVTLTFDTAWSPPINFYDKLLELEFTVNAMYYEPGVNFCGQYFDGQDETYELNNLTSDEARDQLPEELDLAFGISEQIAYWEAEQEEQEDD
jgi:hypothetical protein